MYHITDSLSIRLSSKVYSLFENLVICTHVGQSYTFKIICMKFATCSLYSSLRVDFAKPWYYLSSSDYKHFRRIDFLLNVKTSLICAFIMSRRSFVFWQFKLYRELSGISMRINTLNFNRTAHVTARDRQIISVAH